MKSELLYLKMHLGPEPGDDDDDIDDPPPNG